MTKAKCRRKHEVPSPNGAAVSISGFATASSRELTRAKSRMQRKGIPENAHSPWIGIHGPWLLIFLTNGPLPERSCQRDRGWLEVPAVRAGVTTSSLTAMIRGWPTTSPAAVVGRAA